jgi:hypothetical protein
MAGDVRNHGGVTLVFITPLGRTAGSLLEQTRSAGDGASAARGRVIAVRTWRQRDIIWADADILPE